MKKRIFACMAALALITSVSLTSCSKEDPAQAVDFNSFDLPTGTVSGIAHAITNSTISTPQYAPQGTILFLTVSYANLGIAGSTETYVTTATVSSNGTFTFSTPTKKDGATTVNIRGNQFTAYYSDGSTSKNYVYTTLGTTATLQPGGKAYVTISYTREAAFE